MPKFALPQHKALRLSWIKRRARRLQLAFRADRSTAVIEATVDWYRLHGRSFHLHKEHHA